MNVEIERKFLIPKWHEMSNSIEKAKHTKHIEQFYLSSGDNSELMTRVRIIDNKFAQLCMKSSGLYERDEFEYEIPYNDALALRGYALYYPIKKFRHYFEHDEHLFEIDEFTDHNLGLVVAELELKSVDEEYTVPEWFGEDVTPQEKYCNCNLAQNPYNLWGK
jgi:adenylate cyclase